MNTVKGYVIRKNEHDEYWTIYDNRTGLPAIVRETAMDMLEEMEAVDALELVNSGIISPIPGPQPEH